MKASGQATGDAASAARALTIAPRAARIGEPIAVELELNGDGRWTIEGETVVADDSWIELAPARLERTEGWRLHLALASLEPGQRALPALELFRDGTLVRVEVPADEGNRVDVAAELRAGEDGPRAAVGLREVTFGEPPPVVSIGVGLLVAGLLAAILLVVLARRRRARRRTVAVSVDPLAELFALRRASEGEDGRELYFRACAALRTAFDRAAGADRGALTDEEWTAATAVDPATRERLAALFAEAREVKYALRAPTTFALDEFLRGAREIAQVLAVVPKEAAA